MHENQCTQKRKPCPEVLFFFHAQLSWSTSYRDILLVDVHVLILGNVTMHGFEHFPGKSIKENSTGTLKRRDTSDSFSCGV